MVALLKTSFTAFVLVLVLDLVRNTVPSSKSTSTGETPEYEYDQKKLRFQFTINERRFRVFRGVSMAS